MPTVEVSIVRATPVTTLLESARELRPRILAQREQIEAGRRLPEDLARELASRGLFRVSLPAAYGGYDLGPVESMEIYEELARADASAAWCVWNANTNWTTARLSPEAAHAVYDDPDHMLANSTQPRGEAVVIEGGYRVSGRWPLVSGCQVSTWMILLCVVHADGAPRQMPGGAPELRFMLLPTSACEIVDTWTAGGLRGTGSHDVVVRDAFVPDAFGSYHSDPMVLAEPRYACPLVARITSGLAVMALGVARGAIEALVDLAADKRSAGAGSTLREEPGAQTRLAEAEALVGSARSYLFDTVSIVWNEVVQGSEPLLESRAKVRLAAWHAVTSAVKAVDLIYLTGGATSLYASCPLDRAFRDVHAFTQHYAVHPSGLQPIGQVLYGLEPEFAPGRTRF
jgi:alkylation response protein AidB-like acyl-CoA dehydrogenase